MLGKLSEFIIFLQEICSFYCEITMQMFLQHAVPSI